MNLFRINSIVLFLFIINTFNQPLFASGKIHAEASKAKNYLTRPVLTDYSVGIWGGANYSTTLFSGKFAIANVDIVRSSYRLGRSFGLSGNWRKNDRWSFQVEFNIEQRGMKFEDQSSQKYFIPEINEPRLLTTDVQAEFIQNFYSIPLVANLHFGRVFKWYISGGACFSYLKTARVIGTMEYDYFNTTHSVIIKDRADIELIPTTDYGNDISLLAGIGVIAPLVTGVRGPVASFLIDVRYYQGLFNVYKGEAPDEINPLLLIDPTIEVEDPVHPNDGQVIRNVVFSLRMGVVIAI